tara:strand:- start:1183 stop:1386 length:204 start_codon:yes stop_codon:yes gene_type:complete
MFEKFAGIRRALAPRLRNLFSPVVACVALLTLLAVGSGAGGGVGGRGGGGGGFGLRTLHILISYLLF